MLSQKAKKFVLDTIYMQVDLNGEFMARMSTLPYLSNGDFTDEDIDSILKKIREDKEAGTSTNVDGQ